MRAPLPVPARPGPLLYALLLGGLVQLAAGWGTAIEPPSAGEPLPWRWLRTLAEHPVRGALGSTLLVWGLLGGRGPTPGTRAGTGQRVESGGDRG
jgi:hypothetical protein